MHLISLFSAGCLVLIALAALAEPQGQARSVRIIENPAAEDSAPVRKKEPPIPLLKETLKSSGVRVDVLPEAKFSIGAPIAFRVTAEKAGYVVLVDVDAQGRLSQIYPNMVTLSDPAGVDEKANFLRVGQSITLPDENAGAGYRFVASPPEGVGMVVAILSETPVQVIDLPDVPAALAGQTKAAEFVKDMTRSLQILPAEGRRPVRAPKWAFATTFYSIK
ncbi:DUF4384 domain-containing protein [Beijerinckia mobilis]|uniref:DUF4384 domain-containing protein n=1 Tax=Beijerinckia mobilis TaxID=231434 RepID=UPI00055120A9|nr:DUF4384 domain-containing protein [Beijerinckia mobilis]